MPAISKKPSTRPIPDRLRAAHRKMKADALATWRSWAEAAAGDGTIPELVDLLSVAALLGIREAGAALEADAQAIRDHRATLRALEVCDETVADRLKPWGGNRETLVAAHEAAQREVARLREELDFVDGGAGRFFHVYRKGEIERGTRRIFDDADQVLARLEPPECHDED